MANIVDAIAITLDVPRSAVAVFTRAIVEHLDDLIDGVIFVDDFINHNGNAIVDQSLKRRGRKMLHSHLAPFLLKFVCGESIFTEVGTIQFECLNSGFGHHDCCPPFICY